MLFSENFIYCLPNILPSPSHRAPSLGLWMLGEKWVSGSIPYSWRSQGLIHQVSLFPEEEMPDQKVSFSYKLCHLGGGVMQAKASCSTHSNFSKFIFFFSYRVLELLLWKPGLPQKLSCPPVGDCPSQCSPGAPDHCQEGLELVHRLLKVPQLVLRSVSLLPDTWVGKALSGWHIVLNPPTPTESLYS